MNMTFSGDGGTNVSRNSVRKIFKIANCNTKDMTRLIMTVSEETGFGDEVNSND
jgi:hypothetical protein